MKNYFFIIEIKKKKTVQNSKMIDRAPSQETKKATLSLFKQKQNVNLLLHELDNDIHNMNLDFYMLVTYKIPEWIVTSPL